ncbi:AMP-binding protein [Breoghania sp.]|uniref:AMP-binding protein n=1 Tax=Breoghania sp. TaxID=2065378 RepID=UPI0026132D57|nr:AMP-binding protein [Breoghania sp.]MDJ0931236.1 AMP-binding protein [Breoghania sp.]
MTRAAESVRCGGVALNEASGETAKSLRHLLSLRAAGQSLRVLNRAPWVAELPGQGHIECMTSGSRGKPKVIRRIYASWERSFEVNRDLFNLGAEDRAAVFGTLGASLTLYGLLETLHAGAGAEVLTGMQPDHQAARLEAVGVSVLYATPTQLRLLPSDRVLSGVRLILCGGGGLDGVTAECVQTIFPNAIFREFYGASETSFITLSDEDTPEGLVARAYPDVTIEIRNISDGVGEVWVKSPPISSKDTRKARVSRRAATASS